MTNEIYHNEEAVIVLDFGDVVYKITAPCGPIHLVINPDDDEEEESIDGN